MSEARLFHVDEAMAHGLPESILLNYLRLFIRGNKQKGLHTDDEGKTWMYSTYDSIAEEHPFWTTHQVGRTIRKLREKGIILAEKRGYNPETWFAFVDESSLQITRPVTAKLSRRRSKIAECTLYTELTLKNTEGKPFTFDEVLKYFVKERGIRPSQAEHQAHSFMATHEGQVLKHWKKNASTWIGNAIDWGKAEKMPEAKTFTLKQIESPSGSGMYDRSKYKKVGDDSYTRK